jgi:hypothetical protein
VALVTSLRDGMNLVSYEYVACQGSKKGVLILSEVTDQLFMSYIFFPLHGRICNFVNVHYVSLLGQHNHLELVPF